LVDTRLLHAERRDFAFNATMELRSGAINQWRREMNQDEPSAVESIKPKKGFGDMLLDVFFAPREAYKALSMRPYCLLPLALAMVLGIGFTAVWISNIEPREFVKAQIENSPRADQIPAEAREGIVEQQSRLLKIFAWAGAILGAPLFYLVCAGYFLLVYRYGYSADALQFRQSFSATAMSFLAVGLVQTPLMLATLALKGDWNINPQEAFNASLSLLFEQGETARWLYSLAGSIDLFSLWTIVLLSIGFGVLIGRSARTAAWAVVIPWAVIVAVKVALAALFS
jgi:hypothetical protein